jgi:maleamate amidohydrolase
MPMRRWEAIFSQEDREVLQRAGLGLKQKFGKRPALLIIDMTRAFVGSAGKSMLESVEEAKTSCGDAAREAVGPTKTLLAACRAANIPVFFTAIDYGAVRLSWGPTKIEEKIDPALHEVVDELKPLTSELVIKKAKASGFFGTPLLSCFRKLEIDCLLVAGGSTSGCLRATVVDAFSCNYPSFVVEECTFDRFDLSHLVSLWDMHAKYADVITLDGALDAISSTGR